MELLFVGLFVGVMLGMLIEDQWNVIRRKDNVNKSNYQLKL
jgi:hypothetical protein